MRSAPDAPRHLLLAAGSAGLLAGAIALRLHPDLADRPAVRTLSRLAGENSTVEAVAHAATFPTLQGVGVVALACGCWFAAASAEARASLLRGCMAAVMAAVLAHVLQGLLPPVLKPVFDPASHVQPPVILGNIESLRTTANPDAQSFPSERATLFAGVAIAACGACRSIGWLAVGLTAVTELCRIGLGLHYPSDIMGSFFLAAVAYGVSQKQPFAGLSMMALKWQRASPATFYAAAFAGSFGLATAFEDVRSFLAFIS